MQYKDYFHFHSLKIFLHPEVYEPAEDTFMMLDSINVSSDDTVLEIGTGTGIIALDCAMNGATVICSDCNPYAVELVKKNVEENKSILTGLIDVRYGKLFDIIHQNESFDLIVFNPPYLPTAKEEYVGETGWFDTAVSGGNSGLKTTSSFLNKLSKYLADDGRAFIIFSTNSPKKKYNQILKKNKLVQTTVSKQSFINETIEVHKITKK